MFFYSRVLTFYGMRSLGPSAPRVPELNFFCAAARKYFPCTVQGYYHYYFSMACAFYCCFFLKFHVKCAMLAAFSSRVRLRSRKRVGTEKRTDQQSSLPTASPGRQQRVQQVRYISHNNQRAHILFLFLLVWKNLEPSGRWRQSWDCV